MVFFFAWKAVFTSFLDLYDLSIAIFTGELYVGELRRVTVTDHLFEKIGWKWFSLFCVENGVIADHPLKVLDSED